MRTLAFAVILMLEGAFASATAHAGDGYRASMVLGYSQDARFVVRRTSDFVDTAVKTYEERYSTYQVIETSKITSWECRGDTDGNNVKLSKTADETREQPISVKSCKPEYIQPHILPKGTVLGFFGKVVAPERVSFRPKSYYWKLLTLTAAQGEPLKRWVATPKNNTSLTAAVRETTDHFFILWSSRGNDGYFPFHSEWVEVVPKHEFLNTAERKARYVAAAHAKICADPFRLDFETNKCVIDAWRSAASAAPLSSDEFIEAMTAIVAAEGDQLSLARKYLAETKKTLSPDAIKALERRLVDGFSFQALKMNIEPCATCKLVVEQVLWSIRPGNTATSNSVEVKPIERAHYHDKLNPRGQIVSRKVYGASDFLKAQELTYKGKTFPFGVKNYSPEKIIINIQGLNSLSQSARTGYRSWPWPETIPAGNTVSVETFDAYEGSIWRFSYQNE